MGNYYLPIKIKARYKPEKSVYNKELLVQPVFFPRESGIHFRILKGYGTGSIFATHIDSLVFEDFQDKCLVMYARIIYWYREHFCRDIRITKARIKRLFKKKQSYNPDLPF